MLGMFGTVCIDVVLKTLLHNRGVSGGQAILPSSVHQARTRDSFDIFDGAADYPVATIELSVLRHQGHHDDALVAVEKAVELARDAAAKAIAQALQAVGSDKAEKAREPTDRMT